MRSVLPTARATADPATSSQLSVWPVRYRDRNALTRWTGGRRPGTPESKVDDAGVSVARVSAGGLACVSGGGYAAARIGRCWSHDVHQRVTGSLGEQVGFDRYVRYWSMQPDGRIDMRWSRASTDPWLTVEEVEHALSEQGGGIRVI
jgi:hypothetical protein